MLGLAALKLPSAAGYPIIGPKRYKPILLLPATSERATTLGRPWLALKDETILETNAKQ